MLYTFGSDGAAAAHSDGNEPLDWQNDHVCDVHVLPNWLSAEERIGVKALAHDQRWHRARLRDALRDARESDCAWLEWADSTRWLYEKLASTFVGANRTYRFELRGMNEAPQLVRYRQGGHLSWHQDVGLAGASVRKLALVALVERDSDCAGGTLQFLGDEDRPVAMQPGAAVIFPPFLAHRVTPITAGNRLSLVAWAVGPAFC